VLYASLFISPVLLDGWHIPGIPHKECGQHDLTLAHALHPSSA
jgi:hypothetical protein